MALPIRDKRPAILKYETDTQLFLLLKTHIKLRKQAYNLLLETYGN